MGAGTSSILTAECAEVHGEKQKRSANLCVRCGFKHYMDYIFLQQYPPHAASTTPQGRRPHRKAPAPRLSRWVSRGGAGN